MVLKPEGSVSLGRPRCGWWDDIEIDLKIVWLIDWIDLGENRDK
jgi:hypothetical protein